MKKRLTPWSHGGCDPAFRSEYKFWTDFTGTENDCGGYCCASLEPRLLHPCSPTWAHWGRPCSWTQKGLMPTEPIRAPPPPTPRSPADWKSTGGLQLGFVLGILQLWWGAELLSSRSVRLAACVCGPSIALPLQADPGQEAGSGL